MKILMAGLPGSGKSTQAQKLAEYLGVKFISTGQVLREMAEESEIGRKVRETIDTGSLVDDATVADIMRAKLSQEKHKKGFFPEGKKLSFILDGYPRTVDQLRIFDPGFDRVFYLLITLEEGLKRLLKRGRKDDNEKVIKKRYEAQQERLNQLLDSFKKQGILVEINGNQKIEEIFQEIKESL